MKKSTKATLLSALVFPGTGHLYLKKYLPGIFLAGSTIGALYFVITKAVDKALLITEKIQTGDMPLDITSISELLSNSSTATNTQSLNIATAVLVIAWLIGIFDSYRVGHAQDNDSNNRS